MNVRLGLMLALVVFVEAMALHAGIGLDTSDVLSGDGKGYDRLAVNLLDHHTFSLDESAPYRPSAFRAPGYPALIAITYLVAGRSTLAMRIVQFALLAGTAWMLFHLALPYVGRPAAAAAAVLCATYPPFVFNSIAYLTEPLATFQSVLYVLLLSRVTDDRRRVYSGTLLAGVVLAGCSLVRPTFSLLIVPTIGGLILLEPSLSVRRRLGLSGLVLAGLLFGSLPWTARNLALTGRLIPYAESGKGYSLFLSSLQYSGRLNHRLTGPDWLSAEEEFKRSHRASGQSIPGMSRSENPDAINDRALLIKQDNAYRDMAIRNLRALKPPQWIKGLLVRLGFLWLGTHISYWEPGLLHLLVQAWQDVLAALTLVGCWLCRRQLFRHWLLWLVPLYLTAVHLVFHVEFRYIDPARPFLLIYAGSGLSTLAKALRT